MRAGTVYEYDSLEMARAARIVGAWSEVAAAEVAPKIRVVFRVMPRWGLVSSAR